MVDKQSFGRSSIGNGVSLKYRLRLNTTTLQYSAVAFCDDFILWGLKVEGVSSEGYTFPVEENYREPNGWIGRVSVAAPLFTEGLGKIIDSACAVVRPDAIDRYLARPKGDDCIGSSDPFTKAVCASGGGARGNINLLKLRTFRVATACGETEYLQREFQARMATVANCGGNERCNGSVMGDMMLPINRDFHKLIEWEALGSPPPFPLADVCRAGPALRKIAIEKRAKAEAEVEREQAKTDLLRCAKNAAQRLDDKVTDAKLVANASVKSCSPESMKLTTLYIRAEPTMDWRPVIEGVEDELISFVLEFRARTRRK